MNKTATLKLTDHFSFLGHEKRNLEDYPAEAQSLKKLFKDVDASLIIPTGAFFEAVFESPLFKDTFSLEGKEALMHPDSSNCIQFFFPSEKEELLVAAMTSPEIGAVVKGVVISSKDSSNQRQERYVPATPRMA